MNRNYVYAIPPNKYGVCTIINYSGDAFVNSFLSYFELPGNRNHMRLHNKNSDNPWPEFWYFCPKEFYYLLKTDLFKTAFYRMRVELVFSAPFMEE